MRRFHALFLLLTLPFLTVHAQDTFSIVAVDTVTGEVGSAGASCIAGSILISDIHPGVGAIHTQSFYISGNQQNGRTYMDNGYSPQQIIDSLKFYDVQGNFTQRQYGVVDLHNGGARSAAFTGVNCFDFKGDITGPNYAIQGNILAGLFVLDSMEARFNRATGTLADKLMAAMQGANIVGADTRCTPSGRSSISAFLRVARPSDTTGIYYLDLNVNSTASGVEPIDSLQALYDGWLLTSNEEKAAYQQPFIMYPNPVTDVLHVYSRASWQGHPGVSLRMYNTQGQRVAAWSIETEEGARQTVDIPMAQYARGLYLYEIWKDEQQLLRGKLILK